MSSIAIELQDRYEILSRLGEGGMGEVYLVRPRDGGPRRAIKVLRDVADAEIEARFKREARAMNLLRHPNIVAVHDVGSLKSGRLYISMEYAQGGSLRDLLEQSGRVDSGRAAHILLQLAEAVDHAHARGVIHRDLKPTNLILTSKDHVPDFVKVLDFGVAKIIAPEYADSVRSTGNVALGTPAYMAPELLEGGGGDTRIDIYSLGCIAFELLTGRPPFTGRAVEVFHRHIHEPAPRASQLVSGGGLHPALDELVARCLAKKPDQRPASAGDVADVLRTVVAERQRDMRQWAATPPHGVRSAEPGLLESQTIRIDTSMLRPPPDPAAALLAWQMAVRELAEILVGRDPDGTELRVALRRATMLDEQRVKLMAELQLAGGARPGSEREIALVAAQSHVDDERDRAYRALDRIASRRAAELSGSHAELLHKIATGREALSENC